MAQLTLRVIDGADRGRSFDGLATPVTIGREEGNSIQLNDDRVSRFHIKIQEDLEKIVVTDLESTNGTRVNGEDVQLRILRYGDIISVGRSMLLFGSREQIAERLANLREAGPPTGAYEPSDHRRVEAPHSLDFELNWSDDPQAQNTLHAVLPPELPQRLSPGQAAQLSELLEYFHLRVRTLLESVSAPVNRNEVTLDARQWQSLIDVQARLASYLRGVGRPGDEGE